MAAILAAQRRATVQTTARRSTRRIVVRVGAQHARADRDRAGEMLRNPGLNRRRIIGEKMVERRVILGQVLADAARAMRFVVVNGEDLAVVDASEAPCVIRVGIEPSIAVRNSVAVNEECHFIDRSRSR